MLSHVIQCFNKANTFDTKLPLEVFELEGMSGIKTRIFYNEICSHANTYLEVGSWKGSSLISSCYGNRNLHPYVIENWSMWGGPKDEFTKLVEKFDIHPTIFEEDFGTFDPVTKIDKKIEIYLYDGDHSYDAQYDAIKRMWPVLADECIVMIDDWNDEQQVRKGTLDALRDLKANVIEKFEITYTNDKFPVWRGHTPMPVACHEFWNGIGVFIIKK